MSRQYRQTQARAPSRTRRGCASPRRRSTSTARVGPSRTTISAVAERAGVQRATRLPPLPRRAGAVRRLLVALARRQPAARIRRRWAAIADTAGAHPPRAQPSSTRTTRARSRCSPTSSATRRWTWCAPQFAPFWELPRRGRGLARAAARHQARPCRAAPRRRLPHVAVAHPRQRPEQPRRRRAHGRAGRGGLTAHLDRPYKRTRTAGRFRRPAPAWDRHRGPSAVPRRALPPRPPRRLRRRTTPARSRPTSPSSRSPTPTGSASASPRPTATSTRSATPRQPFTIQSISKPFVYGLALRGPRPRAPWPTKVGVEPTGDAFNSISLAAGARGRPLNPMINAGAIAATSLVARRRRRRALRAPARRAVRRYAGRPLDGRRATVYRLRARDRPPQPRDRPHAAQLRHPRPRIPSRRSTSTSASARSRSTAAT